jgi:hypothetical protein
VLPSFEPCRAKRRRRHLTSLQLKGSALQALAQVWPPAAPGDVRPPKAVPSSAPGGPQAPPGAAGKKPDRGTRRPPAFASPALSPSPGAGTMAELMAELGIASPTRTLPGRSTGPLALHQLDGAEARTDSREEPVSRQVLLYARRVLPRQVLRGASLPMPSSIPRPSLQEAEGVRNRSLHQTVPDPVRACAFWESPVRPILCCATNILPRRQAPIPSPSRRRVDFLGEKPTRPPSSFFLI